VEPYQRFRRFGPKRLGYYERYGKPDVNPTLRLSATREVLYGPIILLNLGVFDPSEPVAIGNFVSCLYPDVNVFAEEYRMWRNASGPFYKSPDEARFVNRLRDALVLEKGDELWLAGGVPRRWLESESGIGIERLVTYFGPVSFRMKAGGAGVVAVDLELPAARPPRAVRLMARVPRGRIRAVTVNGRAWPRFDPDRDIIELPLDAKSVRIGYR
jgi:hypothetical protein